MGAPASSPVCPYCHVSAILVDSVEVYGTGRYGNVWICSNRQHCDARTGCHPGTTRPLGRLANAELRAAKVAAHATFDPLWKCGEMTRSKAYGWLAEQLGIKRQDCHIGDLEVEQCRQVVNACQQVSRR